jgi:hypothetical protein
VYFDLENWMLGHPVGHAGIVVDFNEFELLGPLCRHSP